MEKPKYANWTNYVFSGAALITLGILIVVGSQRLYQSVIQILVLAFFLLGISQVSSIFIHFSKKPEVQKKFPLAVLNLVFAIIMLIFPNVSLSILPILFAIYLLFNCAVKAINYVLLRQANLLEKWKELFLAIFFLVAGVSFLFSPLGHLPTILSVMGAYFIILGVDEFLELLSEVLSPRSKTKMKRAFRLSLPAFLDAFMPRRMLNDINRYFNEMKEIKESDYEVEKEDVEPDLEIFIHVAPHGFNQFGHMDFSFDGKVISYGNYDKPSFRLLDSLGDGVLFETTKEKYIPLCIKHSDKTLIGFGLKLTEHQKKLIRKEYAKMKEKTVSWKPEILTQKKAYQKKKKKDYDYASLLYAETKAVFYKFKEGKFKTYFVLGTNCTSFADKIVGKSGTDILKMVGIITPGTYLDYLEHELKKKNSMVIRKTIYNEVTKEKAIKQKNKKSTLKKKKSMIK